MKNIALFALGLIAAVSIGCGGATTPTAADTSKPVTPQTTAAESAAAKENKGEELSADEQAASAIVPGNKQAGAPRRNAPEGTPKQQ